MLVFAYMFFGARQHYMYRAAHFLFVVQIFMQCRWQKEFVNSIYSDKRNSHEREKECRILSELACLWSTDGCVLMVCWAVELAALEGMCTLAETCCSLTASLHSAESKLLFHSNTWTVHRNCYLNHMRDKDTQITTQLNVQGLFPFLHSYFYAKYVYKDNTKTIIRHKQLLQTVLKVLKCRIKFLPAHQILQR